MHVVLYLYIFYVVLISVQFTPNRRHLLSFFWNPATLQVQLLTLSGLIWKVISGIVFQDDAVEIRPIPDCPKEHIGDRILIRCQAIKYVIQLLNGGGGGTAV